MKSNLKRTKLVILSLCLIVVLHVFSVVSGFLQAGLLQDVIRGAEISYEMAYVNDFREQALAWLLLAAYVFFIVCFLRWFGRAYRNLSIRLGPVSSTVSGAIWCWFIPVLAFFKPGT